MRENITFSVIIPIYNVEAFLKECIDSVLQQTYKDYEIILVDDGSTDESGAIADTYARNYPSINVIHRNNGGLSAARNTGIEAAKGRYIIFVDSDDYIDKNALLNFANCVVRYKEPDIIAAQAYSVNWDGNVKLKCKDHHHIEGIFSGRAFWETAIKANEIFACAPFNAYKTSLIRCTHIYFSEGLLHEDQLWTPTIFWNAKSVVDGDFIFYYHRMRQGSITHSSGHEKKACDLISTCYSLEKMYREYPLSQSKWSRDCVAVLYMSAVFIGAEKVLQKGIVKRIFPIRNACSRKTVMKAILFAISPKLYIELDKIVKAKPNLGE